MPPGALWMSTRELIGYAPHTYCKRNLRGLREAGWRLLYTPTGKTTRLEGMKYALDNGAWHAHTHDVAWDEAGFVKILDRMGAGADWAVLPDIVGGGLESLERSLSWVGRVLDRVPLGLLAVQDGMDADLVRPHLSEKVGIFLGGSTEFKVGTMIAWGQLAREVGCWFHVGRVNSASRILACRNAGAHSFDGSSPTRFAKTLPLLDGARRQLSFEGLL